MGELSLKHWGDLTTERWDNAVDESVSPLFFFKRAYISYHGDELSEISTAYEINGHLVALFPVSVHENNAVSFGGLTFGGLLYNRNLGTKEIFSIMDMALSHYRELGLDRLIYKPTPQIFRSVFSGADEYYIWRQGARVSAVDLSSIWSPENYRKPSKLRIRGRKKAEREAIFLSSLNDTSAFHRMLVANLARHAATPVHSESDLAYLRERFPKEIKLTGAFANDSLVAGVLTFDFGKVVHAQYIASTERGRGAGALDLVFFRIMDQCRERSKFLSFGRSTEDNGRLLNDSLLSQKEGFGSTPFPIFSYALML